MKWFSSAGIYVCLLPLTSVNGYEARLKAGFNHIIKADEGGYYKLLKSGVWFCVLHSSA